MAARPLAGPAWLPSLMTFVRAHLGGAIAAGVLVSFCAVLLRHSLIGGGALLGFDLFNYFFPGKVFAAEMLRQGKLPLWNPSVFFGVPFLANIQMAVLYPPNLLFVVWDFPRAVAVSQWLHLSAGAAGTYALCRFAWRLDRLGAVAGAIVFAGSGFLGAHMGHLNQVHASIWLPWIALCQFRLAATLGRERWSVAGISLRETVAAARRVSPWLVAGGAAVALQICAGHTQEAYYSLFSLALLAAGFTVVPPKWAPSRRAHLPAFVAIAGNGLLIAAVQLLPTIELSRHSYRQGGVPLEEAVAFGVDRTHILETVLPTFWSLPSQEVTGYVGVAGLVLALAGFSVSGARRTVVALAALAVLAITLTLGAYTPLYPLLHQWAPMFSSFRAPGRWLLISTFALAGLAAHGVAALRYRQRSDDRERAALHLGLGLTAAGAALVFVAWRTQEVHAIQWLPHSRVAVLWALGALGTAALASVAVMTRATWPRIALICVVAFELGYAAREMEYNRPGASELYSQSPAVAGYLTAQRETVTPPLAAARTVSLAVEERLDARRLDASVPAQDGEYRRYAAMREALRPNLGVVYGLPSIDGYDGGLLPTRDYARFKELLVTGETPVAHYTLGPQAPARPNARLLGALNVRYLLIDGRAGTPGSDWRPVEAAPGAGWLFENTRVQPRAFLVGDVVSEPDPDRALRLVSAVDLARTAIVERPTGHAFSPLGAEGASARIVSYEPGGLVVDVESPAPALLVLTETYYPGWHATVGGRPAQVVRANVLFRGIPVPAGAHRVSLWYDPLSLKAGAGITVLAIAANLFIVWTARRRSGTAE